MTETYDFFKTSGRNSFVVKWNAMPFHFKGSVFWRGKFIHVQIRSDKTNFGSSHVAVMLYDQQCYTFGNHLYKGNGGCSGFRPRHLGSQPYQLSLCFGTNLFSLTETGPDPRDLKEFFHRHCSMVLSTPDIVSFGGFLRKVTAQRSLTLEEFNELDVNGKRSYLCDEEKVRFIACRPFPDHKFNLFSCLDYFIEVGYVTASHHLTFRAFAEDDPRLNFYIDYMLGMTTLTKI